MLQRRLQLSERRACRITGQHRSTQRHQPRRDRGDALRAWLHAFSRTRPRWGYRRAWVLLRAEGWAVNRKRVQHLWREEGLRVPARRHKRQRVGTSTVPAVRLRAERPKPRLGARLSVRRDRGREDPEVAEHRRRVHSGSAGDAATPPHQRRRHRRRALPHRHAATVRTAVHPLRQTDPS